MAGLTPQGWQAKTLAQIQSDLLAAQRVSIATDLDGDAELVLGRLNGTFASVVRELWELGGAAYDARDPDRATFDGLDGVAAITGTVRQPATQGTVMLDVTLAAATTLPAGSVANVGGQPTNRWVTTQDVTSVGAGVYSVPAQAEAVGPISAASGTITAISTPAVGWMAVTNPLDAAPGRAIEKDTALRLRRQLELASPGTSPLDAIRADLLTVPLVTDVTMFENTSDITDMDGLPPKSVEAVVLGGSDAAVALQLWRSKAGGIETWSSNSPQLIVPIVDSKGTTRNVLFTRPVERDVWISLGLTVDPDTYVGDEAVKAALIAWGVANLKVGTTVIRSKILCIVADLVGVEDVATLTLGFAASPVGTVNLTVGPREYARLDTSRIDVTS